MKKKIIAILLLLSGASNSMAEEIEYSVIKQEGNIEIRQYSKVMIAEIIVKGKREDVISSAFRPLFKYIQGNNVSRDNSSQKIPMTAPVSHYKAGKDEWKVQFYMPNTMTEKNTPSPNNTSIKIKTFESQKIAAIRFSGKATNTSILKHEIKLKSYLEKNKISYNPIPIYAYYNSPFSLPFLRRNEVLFRIKN